MTVTVYSMAQTIPATNYGHRSAELPLHFQCTTEAELPTANLQDGDTANTEDTGKRWKRTAGAWAADTAVSSIATALQETSGPTGLIIGTITDGQYLKRVGATLVSAVPAGGSDAFPIGSVFIAVVSTDPATLLGYGTWSAIAAGRVLVGLDSGDTDFDTVEETGGAKTVTLTGAQSGLPQHTHTQNAHSHNIGQVRDATTGGTATNIAKTADTSSTLGTSTATDSATAVNQDAGPTNAAEAHSNVQPYFVCYFWKRTA